MLIAEDAKGRVVITMSKQQAGTFSNVLAEGETGFGLAGLDELRRLLDSFFELRHVQTKHLIQ